MTTKSESPEHQSGFCYAEGDEGAKYCGDPKSLHCAVLGDAAFWESAEGQQHLVKCMRDDHFIHHVFIASPPLDSPSTPETRAEAPERIRLRLIDNYWQRVIPRSKDDVEYVRLDLVDYPQPLLVPEVMTVPQLIATVNGLRKELSRLSCTSPDVPRLARECAERAYGSNLLFVAKGALGATEEDVTALAAIIESVFTQNNSEPETELEK